MRASDLIGQRFGKLVVIEKVMDTGQIKNKRATWRCKCDCGGFSKLVTGELRRKRGTRSCGCSKNKHRAEHHGWTGYGEIPGKDWARIQRECVRGKNKERTIEFNLTIQQAWELFLKQNRKCALSGMELKFKENSLDRTQTASLDRIDSNKGYTIDNIQWVHKDVNYMKMDLPQDRFIKICKEIASYNK